MVIWSQIQYKTHFKTYLKRKIFSKKWNADNTKISSKKITCLYGKNSLMNEHFCIGSVSRVVVSFVFMNSFFWLEIPFFGRTRLAALVLALIILHGVNALLAPESRQDDNIYFGFDQCHLISISKCEWICRAAMKLICISVALCVLTQVILTDWSYWTKCPDWCFYFAYCNHNYVIIL